MARIRNRLYRVQDLFMESHRCRYKKLQPDVEFSSRLAQEDFQFPRPKQINDYVYEVYKPQGRPSVEVIFFHGVPLEHPSSKDAHISTWVSRDESELWLNWLPRSEDLSYARILTISYDAYPRMTADQGIIDMYCTRENLIPALTEGEAKVGQDGCPVVLVGHCLGGLVMKEVCIQANKIDSETPEDKPNQLVKNLLHNVKGFFMYAPPHQGSRVFDSNTQSQNGVLCEVLTTLNRDAARQNEDFRKLRAKYGWKTSGIGESLAVVLEELDFKGIVVEEASARQDMDEFYTVVADHFTVCRPVSATCSSFQRLSSFISKVVEEDKVRLSNNICLLIEPKAVGLEAHVKKVVKILQTKQRLGLIGIGGIGKTTLAKALFYKISWKFEYVCFLEEVKTKMAKEKTIDHLRAKIIKRLKWKGRDVAKDFRWTALQGERVLIILDDAKDESQVAVMLENDKFSQESRLVVTSRQGFLDRSFEIYYCQALTPNDSKMLFCLHVFGQPEVPSSHKDLMNLVTSFVEKCGGFPLALKVTGRFLSKHIGAKALWDQALERLSNAEPIDGGRDDGLWSVLRVSFYDLHIAEQQMFLDAATCFHMADLGEVQKAWTACSWASSHIGWENLLDRCLVTLNDFGDISMHETLRDMGRNIAGHSRVCTIREANELPQKERAAAKVLRMHRRMVFDIDNIIDDNDIDNRILCGWKGLEILWLENIVLQLEWIGDLQELRYLKLDRMIGQSNQSSHILKRFFVESSPAKNLRKLPKSIGKLRKLRYLQIANCHFLETLPSTIGELCALEHLRIQFCRSLTELPEGIGQLRALTFLEICECEHLTTLPDIGNLQALVRLNINRCPELRELPKSIGKLSKLRHLEIWTCSSLQFKTLPSTIGKVRALESLEIVDCSHIRWLPKSVGKLTELRYLAIQKCSSLETLPSTIGELRALETLDIADCENFISLPKSLGDLSELRCLKMSNCFGEELSHFPHTLGKLSKLETLFIANYPWSIPESFGQLKELHWLTFRSCWLKNFPEFIGQLKKLRYLEFARCRYLESPPSRLLEQLHALENLVIYRCEKIIEFPEWAGQEGVRVWLDQWPHHVNRVEVFKDKANWAFKDYARKI